MIGDKITVVNNLDSLAEIKKGYCGREIGGGGKV